MKLNVELVPRTVWKSNIRSMVTKYQWDKLRKSQYAKAGYVCEICGGKGPRHPVECHEVWEYNDKTKTQTLVKVEALCPACHQVKHLGKAKVDGRLEQALRHLMEINGLKYSRGLSYVHHVFAQYHERSKHRWKIDLSWLDDHGVPYKVEKGREV